MRTALITSDVLGGASFFFAGAIAVPPMLRLCAGALDFRSIHQRKHFANQILWGGWSGARCLAAARRFLCNGSRTIV
jgi:hypothetical protein